MLQTTAKKSGKKWFLIDCDYFTQSRRSQLVQASHLPVLASHLISMDLSFLILLEKISGYIISEV